MVAKKKARKVAGKSAGRSKRGLKKGSKLMCEECGLVIMVSDPCCCGEACDVICCGEQMVLV